MLERIKKTKVALQARRRENFDADWRFMLGDAVGAEKPSFSDDEWRKLHLPHDWSIEGKFDVNLPTGGAGGYLPMGVGWYRKKFTLGKPCAKTYLEFDGVMLDSSVWVNGHYAGGRSYGYASFKCDVTPFVTEGENTVAVRVDASHQPGSRWYPGAGIYRHTYLTQTGGATVENSYVTTPVINDRLAEVNIKTQVKNWIGETRAVRLVTDILDEAGKLVVSAELTKELPPDGTAVYEESVCIPTPELWNIDHPYIYRVHMKLYAANELIDDLGTHFGVREFGYDIKKGFTVNGEQVKIQGLCLHQNFGATGIAVPERMMEENLLKLKRAGCNGIRLTHYPHTPETLDLLDTIGFVAIGEAFDEWNIKRPKYAFVGQSAASEPEEVFKYGYAEYFEKDWRRDLTDMLIRDRNHPAVAFWSIGNEIPEQSKPQGGAMAREMVAVCHEYDPTRPVTSACQDTSGLGESVCSNDYIEALDVVGINYVDHWGTNKETYYFELHEKFPHKIFMGNEHVSSGGVRGKFDLYEHENRWYTMYYNKMIDVEQRHKFLKYHPYVLGDFMWTGVEYMGEAAWPWITPCTGMLDFCGVEKDGYYLLHSIWQTEETVLYLVPHWNYEGHEGEAIPVVCYTNCDYVELFVNGQSYGKKSWQFPRPGMYDHFFEFRQPVLEITTSDLHLEWNIPYTPGEIKAVGIKDGKVVAERVIKTAGTGFRMLLEADTESICADGTDTAKVVVRILDRDGNFVPKAETELQFTVSGAGELLGTDNGSPYVGTGFRQSKKTAFNGIAAAFIRSNGQKGQIVLTVKSKLGTEKVTIKAE